MALRKIGSLAPWGGALVRKHVLQNSDVFAIDDICKSDASGFVTTDSIATAGVYGHVDGLVTFRGTGLTDNGSGANYENLYTAASDNQTVLQVSALIDCSQYSLYSSSLDATVGTTTGSDLFGYYMDLVDEDDLDESTAALTVAQMRTWGTDPADATRAVVNIFESEVFTTV